MPRDDATRTAGASSSFVVEPPVVGRSGRIGTVAPAGAATLVSTQVSTQVSTPWAIAALVAVNLFPLVGVGFLGWSTFELMLLYWFENGVVGLYAVLKMLRTEGEEGSNRHPVGVVGKLFLVGFFIVHYGIFWTVHGLFVVELFGPGGTFGTGLDPALGAVLDGPGDLVAGGLVTGSLLAAAMGLLVSHGVSFVGNVIGRGEDLRTSPNVLMTQPYARVFVLHITLVLGASLLMGLGEPLAALLLFVLLKTGVDLAAHLRSHRSRPTA